MVFVQPRSCWYQAVWGWPSWGSAQAPPTPTDHVSDAQETTRGANPAALLLQVQNWDWNVCHTYYIVPAGQGNVSPGFGGCSGASHADGVLVPFYPEASLDFSRGGGGGGV
jgi:hypothetical protein